MEKHVVQGCNGLTVLGTQGFPTNHGFDTILIKFPIYIEKSDKLILKFMENSWKPKKLKKKKLEKQCMLGDLQKHFKVRVMT